eukprot:TRINITY_DN75977_c0_g1_i1.p1 TRINITY_DN75977_c0_g1~~TRINITY_DN75977_c0_g1_i1.p1  ORF type:complete len:101 (+),score=15.63 TRINITY_DN75977_c0_g1_i1:218-520(+)
MSLPHYCTSSSLGAKVMHVMVEQLVRWLIFYRNITPLCHPVAGVATPEPSIHKCQNHLRQISCCITGCLNYPATAVIIGWTRRQQHNLFHIIILVQRWCM